MKKSSEPRKAIALWHRLLAYTLAISLVLIPVYFPSAAKAAEAAFTGPNNYFVDNFTDSRYMNGVTYQWKTLGDHTGAVKDGVYRFTYTEASGQYNNYIYPTVTGADGTSYSKPWADYTLEFDSRRLSATAANGIATGMTYRIWVRAQADSIDAGISGNVLGYCIDLTGQLTSSGTLCVRKYYLDDGAVTNTIVEGKTASVPTTPDTWYKWKVEVAGNTITVRYNNAVVLSVTDKGDQSSGQPYASGVPMLGTQGREGITEFDNVKITPADGSTVMADFFTDSRFIDGVTYKWVSRDGKGGWAVENGMLTAKRTATSNNTYMGLQMLTGSSSTDLAANMTDYAVEVDLSRTTDKALFGILLRAKTRSSAYDMYEAYINVNGQLFLRKRHNGSNSNAIASVSGLDFRKNTWHTMKAEVQKNFIRIYYDGNLVLTYDTTNDSTGMSVDGTTALWSAGKTDKDAANTPYANGTIGLSISSSSGADPTPTVLCKNLAVYPIEMSASRLYDKHLFNVESVEDLTLWDVAASDTGAWSIVDNKLTYTDNADAKGLSTLKAKTKVENASMILEGSAVEGGSFAVLGRYSTKGYYKLALDTVTGISLYKSNGTTDVELDSLSLIEAYTLGIRVEPDTVYTLKLQMLDGTIAGFVNDECVLRYADSEPLPLGVAGIEATNGSSFRYLEIAELSDVVTNLNIVESIDYGVNRSNLENATFTEWTRPVQVAVGGVPDIKNLYLKVTYYDGSTSYVPLDMADLPEFDVAEAGNKKITVNYMQGQTTLDYTVLDRTEAIGQLNDYAAALNTEALTLNDKTTLHTWLSLYNDLSATEKAQVLEENQQKLAAARAAIDVLVAPELEGSQIVYEDSFDTAISEENYENHMSVTGVRNSGYWHVEDGKFLQYSADDQFRSASYYAATVIKDKNWSVSSVSADVRIIDESAWIGLNANFVDGNNVFRLMITDKVMSHAEKDYNENGSFTTTPTASGTRVDLYKNSTLVVRRVLTGNEMIQTGQWYNLKMTMVDGQIRVYLDDAKLIDWTDVTTTATGATSEAGTAGLLSTEGWGEFDNLIVRGVDVPTGEEDTKVTLEPGEFTDNFNDEKDNLGADPSHWIEATSADAGKWVVKQTGDGEYAYGTVGALRDFTKTWLHVFETDVDYTADITVADLGYYPIFGLVARDNATNSYIRAGYDATFQKWFIKVRLGEDFKETVVYSDVAPISEGDTIKLRLLAKGRELSLYVNSDEEPVVTADAGTKVMPGRVGVYADCCEIIVDNVDLQLLSGQGRVNDGVWEYYAKETNVTTSLHQFLELPDKNILLLTEGNQWISHNGGKTFEKTNDYVIYGSNQIKLPAGLKFTVGQREVDTYEDVYIGIQSIKPDRENYENWTSYQAFLYTDNLSKKVALGVLPTEDYIKYAQPGDHMNMVSMGDGKYRIFFTAGRQSGLEEGRAVLSETYYSDDFGQTWNKSVNSPQDFTNLKNWCETKVIKITKDVTDFAGNTIPAGTMIQYCSYNTSEFMRYSLSYDGGKTWEGDYVMPTIPTCLGSFSVEEDLYNPGTYYMATIYNYPYNAGNGRPRHRIALLRSTDGFNWEFLADVDRWGDVSDGGRAEIMQNVNMYIDVTEDYIFPSFSRSDAYLNSSSGHNLQLGRVYRFEKAKLEAYDEWPAEYFISSKTILYIEGPDAEVTLNSAYSADEVFFTVYYYGVNGQSYSEQIPLSEAIYTAVDTSVMGEQTVTIDYGMYRDIYTVTVSSGEKPVIEGVEQDKNYCGQQIVTVTDPNGDLLSVTLDGNLTSLQNGKLVVLPSTEMEEHTIVVTDKAGNTTNVTFKVYPAHAGGDAKCNAMAICDNCSQPYGEYDTDDHAAEAVWVKTQTTHKMWHDDCCDAIVTAEAKHTFVDGKCSVCDYGCQHTGGTATCIAEAVCTNCGASYGEVDADNHAAEAVWVKTQSTHKLWHDDCCDAIVTAEAKHTFVDGKCSVCDYGCQHTGGTATCVAKAECTNCGEEYGEKDPDQHTKEAKWLLGADKHSKAYECCGEVVVAEAAHSGGTATCEDKAVCTVCNAEYGVLADHKGGEATCTAKAKCSVCGEEYGEKDADKHTGEAKWSHNDEKHSKKYDCCGKVVVAEEAHKLTDGKCECGYEAPKPVEPGEIVNTTDSDKNACGGSLDVKDEHLDDKILTEEEKEAVKGGADIEISLKIEDISDKVSAADKTAVENKLNGMKIGLHLNIDLEKKIGDKDPVKVTKTNGGVTVTITVPKELINTDSKYVRTYKVIRVHEGVADILDTIFDAETGNLSFETDKFSTYTLVYSDAPSSDNSNTGDNIMLVLFGGLLALSALAAGVLLVPDIRKKLLGK